MQKVVTFPNAAAQQKPPPAQATEDSPSILERSGHTFIGSVLFVDIVEYSKKPVAEQLQVKDRFNGCLSEALADITPSDRIILDTGDGAAVNFLGDPEDALFVAMNLAGRLDGGGDPTLQVRIGINLGPVRLMRDTNGLPNIVGDGINVAQRVMSFARPGQVLVSRSYHEAVTRLSQEYAALFSYLGSRTDKHVREHEVYVVSAPVVQVQELARRRQRQRPARAKAGAAPARGAWLRSAGLAWGFLSLAAATLAVAAYLSLTETEQAPAPAARPAAPPRVAAAPPRPVEPTPMPEPAPMVEQAASAAAEAEPPAPERAEPAVSAAPAPAAAPARSRSLPSRAAAGGATTLVLPSPAPDRPPEPALIKPEPRPDPTPETRTEPAGSKPLTLPTQYRAAAGPTALVMLAISPWGEVLVDGKMVGVSPPMNELELSPGKHRIEVRNGAFKPYRTEVDLGPNETTRIKHKFLYGR